MLHWASIAIDPEQHASRSMSDTVSAKAFANIFKHSTPLLDVRSPTEFQRGAFQHASNLPLLDDGEREAVGTRYRQQGAEAAIALGRQASVADDGSAVAGRTAGLAAWLVTNTNFGIGGSAGGFDFVTKLVDAPVEGTIKALTWASIRDVILGVYTAGGAASGDAEQVRVRARNNPPRNGAEA